MKVLHQDWSVLVDIELQHVGKIRDIGATRNKMATKELCPDCNSPSVYTEHEIGWGFATFYDCYECPPCGTKFAIGMVFGKPDRVKSVHHKIFWFEWDTWRKY